MKHKFKIFIVTLCLAFIFILKSEDNNNLNQLMFNTNVEALANTEEGGRYFCAGSGSIDCKSEKVEFKFSGFR